MKKTKKPKRQYARSEQRARRAYRWHDHEKFIRIWQKASSLSEAAERYGASVVTASTLAHNLRVRGIKLKDFRTNSGRKLDYGRLAAIAAGKA